MGVGEPSGRCRSCRVRSETRPARIRPPQSPIGAGWWVGWTYDLRRLRLKGLIERVEGTHTSCVTPRGRAVATFFTCLAARVVVPVLTELEATTRTPRHAPSDLVGAWRANDRELRRTVKNLSAVA